MLDLSRIAPQEGVVAPRPASLRIAEGLTANQTDEMIMELFEKGRVAVFGGMSLIGEQGYIVQVIGCFKMSSNNLRGWWLRVGHPGKPELDFEFVDASEANPLEELPFPNCMTYFVCETDERLLEPDTPEDERIEIARFIAPFISDSGPPAGTEWGPDWK